MFNRRVIYTITGIRSEYEILLPILELLNKDPEIDLGIVACGTHLIENYGYTIHNIIKDGFKIVDRIDYLMASNSDAGRAKGISLLIEGLISCVIRSKPDFLLVVGDREESIATGIVGNYLKIPVFHIGGGDEAINNADDPIRHATSKLAHIHFTICEKFKQNLLQMGEEPFRVYNVGNPGLDRIRNTQKLSRKETSELIQFDLGDESEPILLVLQHPLSSESEQSYEQMKMTMEAIFELGMKSVVIYPNSDPGSYDIIRAIEEYRDVSHIKIVENLDRIRFVNVLRYASCMVGNSSSGLLEAPFLKKPVINVGNRQKGRINAGNVIFVPNDKDVIKETIRKIVTDEKYVSSILQGIDQYYYGDGYSAEKIIETIKHLKTNENLINKKNIWN